jgi:hypothetical protein
MLMVVPILLAVACGSSDPAPDAKLQGDGQPTGDGPKPSTDGNPAGDSPGASCACGSSQGCILAVVTRVADEKNLPWKIWPSEADGAGTLIVSATQGTTVLARKSVANADLKTAGAKYEVDLGCVATGASDVRAFLDDNGNAGASDTFSADYRDTCLGARKVTVTVEDGKQVRVELPLANSCD